MEEKLPSHDDIGNDLSCTSGDSNSHLTSSDASGGSSSHTTTAANQTGNAKTEMPKKRRRNSRKRLIGRKPKMHGTTKKSVNIATSAKTCSVSTQEASLPAVPSTSASVPKKRRYRKRKNQVGMPKKYARKKKQESNAAHA